MIFLGRSKGKFKRIPPSLSDDLVNTRHELQLKKEKGLTREVIKNSCLFSISALLPPIYLGSR